ncbi:MAG: type II toxin-antitoxin system VapC family toxin [Nitrospiraceae bacterium]|nr:type II toxin-antitoxin system VapC family toxin [Nitrospiraceae bacterium]
MILYLGPSSLIKLYVQDEDSEMVRRWVHEAEIVAVCRVAYAEIAAALDARHKGGDFSTKDYNRVVSAFADDWAHLAVVDFDDIEAGRLVRKYGLHRMAAIHLSAVLLVKKSAKGLDLAFSSADVDLCRAAAAEGLRVMKLS